MLRGIRSVSVHLGVLSGHRRVVILGHRSSGRPGVGRGSPESMGISWKEERVVSTGPTKGY